MSVTNEASLGPVSTTDAAALSARITGPVLLPDDAGYRDECGTFNLLTAVQPALAVGATSVADVRAAVRFAAQRGLPVAVLSTGHQLAGDADGAVLINLSRMTAVHIDTTRPVARVEGGAQWQRVLDEADKFGLAPASGSSGTVGVVGYHLGGGQSPILGRTYGYAADHVHALEVVTADGELRRVTSYSEPELFWALRGGKGNFGVVTALEFGLFPVKRFYGGGLFYSGTHAAKVLHTWRHWAADLPKKTTTSIAFLRLPPLPGVPEPLRGTFVMHVRFASLRLPEEAERLLAPMREIAPTVLDTIDERPYRLAGEVHMDPPAPVPWRDRAIALRTFPAEAADALLIMAGRDSATQLGIVEVRALGGALAQPPVVPNAVAGRDAPWAVTGIGVGGPDQAPVLDAQLTALVKSLRPWAQDEIMANFLSVAQGATPDELRTIYGPDRYDRLAAIKTRYDPQNLFRITHNIPPA